MTTGRCLAVTVSPVSGMWNSIRSSSHSRSLGNSRSALSISSMSRITCSSAVNASPSLPSRTYLAMSSRLPLDEQGLLEHHGDVHRPHQLLRGHIVLTSAKLAHIPFLSGASRPHPYQNNRCHFTQFPHKMQGFRTNTAALALLKKTAGARGYAHSCRFSVQFSSLPLIGPAHYTARHRGRPTRGEGRRPAGPGPDRIRRGRWPHRGSATGRGAPGSGWTAARRSRAAPAR